MGWKGHVGRIRVRFGRELCHTIAIEIRKASRRTAEQQNSRTADFSSVMEKGLRESRKEQGMFSVIRQRLARQRESEILKLNV